MSHADNSNTLHRLVRILLLALLIGLVRKIRKKLLQVSLGSNAIDRHDFYHSAVQLTVPDIALRERLDFEGSNQEVAGFNRIAEEVVVIHVVDLKAHVLHVLLQGRGIHSL